MPWEKLLGLDTTKLALVVAVLALGGLASSGIAKAWRIKNKRELTAFTIVDLIERANTPFPRNWGTLMDDRIVHKINNHPGLQQAVAQLREVRDGVGEVKQEVKTLTKTVDRMIGKLFPEEPLG